MRIGFCSNVQDGTIIEEAPTELGYDHDGSTIIGHYVTIGHDCVLRACTVENTCLVGMGSVLCEGSYMEHGSILGARSVLRPFQRIPSHQVIFNQYFNIIFFQFYYFYFFCFSQISKFKLFYSFFFRVKY